MFHTILTSTFASKIRSHRSEDEKFFCQNPHQANCSSNATSFFSDFLHPASQCLIPLSGKFLASFWSAEPTNQNCFCCCRMAFYQDSLCSFLKNFSHQISFFDCTGYIQDYSSQCCNYVGLPIMAIWYRIGLPMPATICSGNARGKLGRIKIKD